MDYRISPVPYNQAERSAALRSAMCAYVPREDRFDRITRLTKRLLDVRIVLISMIDDDEAWFRSAQGLDISDNTRDISFCGHTSLTPDIVQVRDMLADPRFVDHPLVVGPPYVRAYCGWPLEIALGLRVGTLCVLDTMPRTFTSDDMETLADMAHMVESELRINAMTDNQKALLAHSSREQRKKMLDPLTGCWSEAGFIGLLSRTLKDVLAGQVHAALYGIQVVNHGDFDITDEQGSTSVKTMLMAQFIRQRLPANAILCCSPSGRGCILFAERDASVLLAQIASFLQEQGAAPVAGMVFPMQMKLVSSGLRLEAAGAELSPELLFEKVMGQLSKRKELRSTLR